MDISKFLQSADFARAVIFLGTSAGVALDPTQIQAIVAGGFALIGVLHALRPLFKK